MSVRARKTDCHLKIEGIGQNNINDTAATVPSTPNI
jgi:hypothetical protein